MEVFANALHGDTGRVYVCKSFLKIEVWKNVINANKMKLVKSPKIWGRVIC
jgi:hypothetical protein